MTSGPLPIPTNEQPPSPGVPPVSAQLSAEIAEQWSWASSAARIPQISSVVITVSAELSNAKVSVVLHDGEETFGTTSTEGGIPAGTTQFGSLHVPLSPRAMARVDERRVAECVIELEDAITNRVIARTTQSVDLQPRDLWFWKGDPRRAHDEGGDLGTAVLARSLLASFVRPNHPEVAAIAREAAERLGRATGEASFHAFQLSDPAEAEARVEASVTAIYQALQDRDIAYSEPPPGWDYRTAGQRIRDHGDVARHGLGTCMDTTVLTAAVLEHAGLYPLLVLIPGHIFIGYWRRDPYPEGANTPEWYPDAPVVLDMRRVIELLDGGWLGLLETTVFTAGKSVSADGARGEALARLRSGLAGGYVVLIDVAAARHAGVAPLPVINDRADGVTEVIEYRPGGAFQRTEVQSEPGAWRAGPRFVDTHPPRYRTWKSSLFSLNATNALLNLGNGPSVQPICLPGDGLGLLEDRLNQDVEFAVLSGFEIPEVYRARDVPNALFMERSDQLDFLADRKLFIQRISTTRSANGPVPPAKFATEMRAMARRAKEAHDERGMNPLFLCLGMLRWPYKNGELADAPLILVPVRLATRRGSGGRYTLALDTASQTTPNAALIEWLRREHNLVIPELAEPAADHAGIDVDGVLRAVRSAIAQNGLRSTVESQAKLALLDLSAFRMWQDLHINGHTFLDRPLIRHLVHTPTEQFSDPAAPTEAAAVSVAGEEGDVEKLETPIPADATQKTAVLWARQGRTFVLQGPPGTGKSQTITNMVAECVSTGMRVLFVAEKGTALSVVQRRLDAVGLTPFTLNLHHEGSNAAEVRAQLKRSLTARVTPDLAALENAQRRLRNSRFELGQYPVRLHRTNTAGLSAYSAHDQLLVLGDGPEVPIPNEVVASRADLVQHLGGLFSGLQPLAAAARVRSGHPWRLVGNPTTGQLDIETVSTAIRGILAGLAWSETLDGPLRDAIAEVTQPAQLRALSVAANPTLPRGDVLAAVLDPAWPDAANAALANCEQAVERARQSLHGYSPEVIQVDLAAVQKDFQSATASGVFGRGKRQLAALEPLARFAPGSTELSPDHAGAILRDLIAAQQASNWVLGTLAACPGVAPALWFNPLAPGSLVPIRERFEQLRLVTTELRGSSEWSRRARDLAIAGSLSGSAGGLDAYSGAWDKFWASAGVTQVDFDVWRAGRSLAEATRACADAWSQQVEHERLLPLQRWFELVRYLSPLAADLPDARSDILDGRLSADIAEDAFARGVARASLRERISAEGLDHFDSTAHDQRVRSYATADAEVRRQWVSAVPARLLDERGGGGAGAHSGGLARELEKTRNRLGIRAILRRYGEAVRELCPLVLCSPASAVDLIEPGVLDFDIVIFDEASQITVPEAVGAIGRAKAVVVVGDSRQMPPTRKIGTQTADDEEIEDPDVEEVVEDQESILSECELARIPTLQLSWHYRSQDEALIAFSNTAYYDGALSSFPTPTLTSADTGVRFRRIAGRFIRTSSSETQELTPGVTAGKGTNPEEALAIVSTVRELLSGLRRPTVGIVTFNEQQRQLIEDLLHAADVPAINAAMDETRMKPDEVLFVKALEQVQGDERDVVLFSIAFSKQANGKIPLNFGPLSNVGGERRLNVAVTRARRTNIVFCSFDPEELEAESASYRGVKDLKQFLLFARSAGNAGTVAAAPGRRDVRDRHRDDIAAALRTAGLNVRTDIGLSDFRLDLVISRPDTPDRVVLPVLLDGESWRSRRSVSDRDVLPVEVLKNLMGWPSVARVWWPMWLQNRPEVIDRIFAEVASAEAALDAATAPDPAAGRAPAPAESAPPNEPSPETSPAGQRDSLAASVSAGTAEPSPSAPAIIPQAPVPNRAATDGTPMLAEATPFVAAHSNVVGERSVLDALPAPAASAKVREQIINVIDTEGPVEIGRLARIVARRFGLSAVREARAEAIVRIVPRSSIRKARHGTFAWPEGLSPATWTGYRTANPNAPRALDEIALDEIANGIDAITATSPNLDEAEVLRRVAELFGVARLGTTSRQRLEAALKLARMRASRRSERADAVESTPHASTPPAETGASAPSPAGMARGANVLISDGSANAPAALVIGLGWDCAPTGTSRAVELDGSALAVGGDGRVLSDEHFVFYNNPSTPDGAVVHRGNSSADSPDREQIAVDLSHVPEHVDKIVFVASIDDQHASGHTYRLVQRANIRVVDERDGAELTRFDVTSGISGDETAMIFGELYRRGSQWKFRAVGQGYASGLRGVATDFGVDVE